MSLAPRLAALALHVVPRKAVSRAIGGVADVAAGRATLDRAIRTFVSTYGVDLDEAVVPEGGFRSFNEFFTRALKPGRRPLDPDPRTLLSPADGKLEDFGPVSATGALTIKGRPYSAVELLGGDEAAARYLGGTYFIVYLSPRDYHRVHAPVTGRVERLRYVPGTLFPVNRIGTDYIEHVFSRNERVAVEQRTETFGRVTSILVGAVGVGRIGLAFDATLSNVGLPAFDRPLPDGPVLGRGDELGRFNLGSTVIGFVERGVSVDFIPAAGSAVRMGTALARRTTA